MAMLVARAIMEVRDETKSVHPFFGKRNTVCKATHDDSSGANSTASTDKTVSNESVFVITEINETVGPTRTKSVNPTPNNPTKGSNKAEVPRNKTFGEGSKELLEVDSNLDRRKRHKSGSPGHESLVSESLGSSNGNIHTAAYAGRNAQSEAIVHSAFTVHGHGVEGFEEQPSFNTNTPIRVASKVNQANLQTPSAAVDTDVVDIHTSLATHGVSNDGAKASSDTSAITPEASVSKPKKTLRFNAKTGTIGSPPARKSSGSSLSSGTKKKSGKSLNQSQSIVVAIKYGHEGESRCGTGQSINEILSGLKCPTPRTAKPTPPKGPSKSTHPFFLSKSAPKVLTPSYAEESATEPTKEAKPTKSKSSMTLGEAKSYSPAKRQSYAPGIGAFQNFGNTSRTVKCPGAVWACWPPKEMVHIRDSITVACVPSTLDRVAVISTQRKSKYTATEALAKDDILKLMVTKLCIPDVLEELKNTNADDFREPARCLRVPTKHFENGYQIQRRVRRELSIKIALNTASDNSSDSEDELHGDGKQGTLASHAILKIYKSLPGSLTAFDCSQYETQPWIHKYSPCNAAEVLQCGKEAFILKEWLQSLTIAAVNPGVSDGARGRATAVGSRRSGVSNTEKTGKKKRKSTKLDGFVISSEEEDDEMDEISSPETNTEERNGIAKRTVVRSGDLSNRNTRDSKKLKNAVVISGPSGCGKTSMVYGVARELGFEVFEINPNSRRSGKEILERVGDMTRNHLVHRLDNVSPSDDQDDDIQRISDALSADLKSGRQGTMNSFFKAKKSISPGLKNVKLTATREKDASDEARKSSKVPHTQQKQSLILLEEVDILFEEDKQFWTTVMNLITQSKRPIIMTCNDETLLPLNALELHAIIRLSPPPLDVAVDYMLLIAAAEGHIVKRRAVKALYEARRCDLRATLTELNYWCQLGIGDRKGGLDWFYPRWPPGCDVDDDGHKIRVLSEGTYKVGMGWLGRDHIFERLGESGVEEEILHEAWDGWNIDIGDWHKSLTPTSQMRDTTCDSRPPFLLSYDAFAESMSVADICSCCSLATGNQVLLDTGAPLVTAKARDDFIIGHELLQADTVVSYDTLNKKISHWMKSQARRMLKSNNQLVFEAPCEAEVSAKIAALGCQKDDTICRQDFSNAFDAISEPERNTLQSSSALELSVFDRTTTTIAVDVAPYVRSIVAYDVKLQQERARLSNLLSEGGRKGKRLRTTRSALSALEGGTRNTTRPDKYFRVPLNPHLVHRTGMPSWQDALNAEMSETEVVETTTVFEGPEASSPGMTDSSRECLE